tara:strand:+ start:468 stop:1934 length:1467 start_codon:yes stop_codon:yes gene_type:complete
MKEKVYLVNAGNDVGMSAIANDSCFPALGVLALGTWLQKRIPEIEVICRDGQVASMDEISEVWWNNNLLLVGISTLSTSYQNAIEIAHRAAVFGTSIVFGNDHAAQTAATMMEQQAIVTQVIGSEYGEESLEALIRHILTKPYDEDPVEVPHLSFYGRKGPVISDNSARSTSIVNSRLNPSGVRKGALDVFPIVDRTLYPESHWQAYLKNYKAKFGHLHDEEITGVTTMNRARGCSRQKEYVCKHCDMGLDIAFSSPEMFWREVRAAHEQVEANVFYEVCDSLSSFGSFVKSVAEQRPEDLGFNPHFFVYAQAIDLVRKPKMVEQFQEMGVFRANLGLESGCDTTLQHMKGKYDSVETNYVALKMLHDEGIHVYGSFVLGTEAETPETLDKTVTWIKRIISEGLIQDIEVQPILPLPNNYYGQVLVDSGLWVPTMDWPQNTDSISRTYIDNCSGISYDEAIAAANEVRDFSRGKVNFGSGVSQENNYK